MGCTVDRGTPIIDLRPSPSPYLCPPSSRFRRGMAHQVCACCGIRAVSVVLDSRSSSRGDILPCLCCSGGREGCQLKMRNAMQINSTCEFKKRLMNLLFCTLKSMYYGVLFDEKSSNCCQGVRPTRQHPENKELGYGCVKIYISVRFVRADAPRLFRNFLPVLFNHVKYHAVVLVLLEARDDDNGDDALDPCHADRHSATVDGVVLSLVGAHTVFSAEALLVGIELAVHEPGADAEAEHRAALSPHPDLVVGRGPRPHGRLEHDLPAVGQRD